MKCKKKIFFVILSLFMYTSVVSAKSTLLTCEYYHPRNELDGKSKSIAVLCKIYDDYDHDCYMKVNATKATTKSNKESIQTWGGFWDSYEGNIKDWVKKNKQCPDYMAVKIDGAYELAAYTTKKKAQDFIEERAKTNNTFYLAPRKGLDNSEEKKTAEKNIQNHIDHINSVMQNYSFESCSNVDENGIKYWSECSSILDALEIYINSSGDTVDAILAAETFTEKDEIIKSYNETVSKAQEFLEKSNQELSEYDKERDQQLGLGPIDVTDNTTTLETSDLDCNGIFAGNFGTLLKQILSFIRFLAPILIIGLSIIDFIKATASQDDSEIKKAANKLVKRMVIGTIIFILPTLLELIFYLAGIDYGTCGVK